MTHRKDRLGLLDCDELGDGSQSASSYGEALELDRYTKRRGGVHCSGKRKVEVGATTTHAMQ